MESSPDLGDALMALISAVIANPGDAIGSFREWCVIHRSEIEAMAQEGGYRAFV
jgi:hypothetical protein